MDNANKENILWIENAKTAQERIAQARKLKKVAETGGLRFEAYLIPDLAEWVLDMVEKGSFLDLSEAIFVMMQQAKELDEYDDLKLELLKRRINKGVEDIEEGNTISAEDAFKKIKEKVSKKGKTAIWKKIEQPETKDSSIIEKTP